MTALAWTTDAPSVDGWWFWDREATFGIVPVHARYYHGEWCWFDTNVQRYEPIPEGEGRWLYADPERIVRMDAALREIGCDERERGRCLACQNWVHADNISDEDSCPDCGSSIDYGAGLYLYVGIARAALDDAKETP